MPFTSNAIMGKQELRTKVFNLITERMKILCLNTQGLNVERINFLHPNYHPSSTEHTSITMGCNFNISDEELTTVLDLTEVTNHNESLLDHSGYRCYIRSFTINYELMYCLARKWLDQGLYASIVNVWLSHLQQHPGRDFHYRYVGHKVSNNVKRHTTLTSSRLHGFVKRFFDTLKEITCKEVWWENYRYFYVNPFSPSCPGYNLFNFKILKEHEQMLISFFGIDNLLNFQGGNTQKSYDPGQEEFSKYIQLPTRQEFFQTYRTLNRVDLADVQGSFSEWIALVAAGGNSINARPALSEKQLEFIYNQAMPKYVDNNGNIVLVCISDFAPLTAAKNDQYFFNPENNHSGVILCDHLARLEAWQEGLAHYELKSYAEAFPFLNIIPWTASSKEIKVLQEGAQQINHYMRITLPLITISISDSASKFCFSSFIHPFGSTRYKSFVNDVVGVPKRVYINDITLLQDKDVKDMPQENSTIVIPHLHPNIDKYTARDNTGVRSIIDLTWQITLCVAQVAMTCSNQFPFLSREQLVTFIADRCLPNSPQLDQTLEILYGRLNQAKNDLQMFEQERNSNNHRVVSKSSASVSRAQRSENGRFEHFGLAKGQPYSSKRKEQADRLWITNFPNLHLHISREHKDEWYNWIMRLKEDKCIAASVWHEMSVAEKPSRNYATLKRFRPEDESGEQDDWMNDPVKVAEAKKRWHQSIAPSVPTSHFSSEAQSKRRREFLESTYSANIEGSYQSVQKQGYFMIFWRSPTEE